MFEIRMTSGGGTDRLFCSAETLEEAQEIGSLYGWEFMDENGFVWNLYLA